MKIRNGFVSNSSSSSFIVRLESKESVFKGMYCEKELLSKEDLQKVLDFGFKPATFRHASALESESYSWFDQNSEEVTEKTEQLGYCVSCNEDEVIEFLVRNNIPFTGSTHYGHRSVFFKRGDKTLLWLSNLGLEYEMCAHGDNHMTQYLRDQMNKSKAIREEPIETYLGPPLDND